MPSIARLLALIALLTATACGEDRAGDDDDDLTGADAGDEGADAAADDAGAADAAVEAPAARCAVDCEAGDPAPEETCFGDALTNGFGRLDGTLLAVQRPSDTQCAFPNDDHLIVQVLMGGAAYRMVVNILSDGRNGTDTRLRFADVAAPLPSPAFEEGWHLDAPLDYAGTLDAHEEDFTPFETDALIGEVVSRVTIGAPISVYATSQDRPESAHLIHRNHTDEDGAIVVDPAGDPHFLLFHFDGQRF